ncbi:TonB-dependent receptor plug domain-containing protein [Sphingomonas sp. 3-13AW]|jgi:vitamin B12 transporter|uniref:TonB-dependent receptor plug domain-containing protein n=1 Tax=Sphingomonas sp. 3-13AW TaxID=3050450 RepID=UPI003BB64C4F
MLKGVFVIRILVPLPLLFSLPAVAQEASLPDVATAPESSDIIVTANRTPTASDRIAAAVTVIDKEAIDQAQDLSVANLLLRSPGVTLSSNGGYGTATSVRIRGAEGDQTVVVIDGVKLNDPSSTGGGYNFANLLVGDASRIEVLRGVQSILWGSQALGGVVNVVTPLPTSKLEGSFDVEGGSRDTVSARAAVGGSTGPLAWRVGGQTFTTDGISAVAPAFGGRERDGYRNRSAQGRAKLDLATGVSAEVRGYYADGRVDIDGFAGDTLEYSRNREFVGYAGLNVDLLGGRLRNRFAYGYTDTNRDNFDPTRERPQTFDAAGRNNRLEYQGSLAIATGWNAVFGIENERSRFHSVSPSASLADPLPDPARGKAELTGIYGQVNGMVIDGVTLTAGLRHDDHNRYGSKTLFAAGGAWALPWDMMLRASYSEGFKAPTLYQLYSEYGNQGLNPERARSWEAGVEQRLFARAVTVAATYFERRTRDQIDYIGCGATPDPLCVVPGTDLPRWGYYDNIARAFARGVEANASARLGARVTADGNFTWTEAENRSPGASFGNWLPRRPRYTANASATYRLPSGSSLGVALRWAGKSYDNAANTTRLDDYTLVDLRGELPISPNVRLVARVENLFDENYTTVYRYGTLGRSVYAGLRGRF